MTNVSRLIITHIIKNSANLRAGKLMRRLCPEYFTCGPYNYLLHTGIKSETYYALLLYRHEITFHAWRLTFTRLGNFVVLKNARCQNNETKIYLMSSTYSFVYILILLTNLFNLCRRYSAIYIVNS